MSALLLLAQVGTAVADILPAGRRTTWNPGIPGGIPARTTICKNVLASDYGNGTQNARDGIQAAINACPPGQVVQLSAGDFLVNGPDGLYVDKGVVLRGAGTATRLRKTTTVDAVPVIVVGVQYPTPVVPSVNLGVDAPKGATSVQVSPVTGFAVGQLVLLDEVTDTSYVNWGTDPASVPGGPARGWFSRPDRPVTQMLEIAGIAGNTVSFTTPLHIGFDLAHGAQLTRYVETAVKNAGVEDLYVRGGLDDNITMRFAMYSWIKNVESDWSTGDSIGIDRSFRCVLRDSFVHDTPDANPGGAGYLLSLAEATSDTLVENNIFVNGNKVMVMRATGGGNVIGYNYFDNGYIDYDPGWMETGLNASHMTCPHFELFEGNSAFNIDGDDTWGGAVYNTFFRNHATGKRRSFSDLSNRRAIGLMFYHYYYSFVGNVLGTANENPTPSHGFAQEDFFPWDDDPIGLWRLGYSPKDWTLPADPRVVSTTHRHLNWDYASNSAPPTPGYDLTLPSSLYLSAKPAFFGSNTWPWVDPVGATKLYTLPAKARYESTGVVQSRFYTLTPCRVADTRQADAQSAGPALSATRTRDFPVAGLCGVPADARAVAANVTVVLPGAAGYLTLFPPGTSPPTSTINFLPGAVRANNATLALGLSGGVSVFCGTAAGQAHVIIDVVGYYK